ncbi:tetratricopeptide repeat protein [Pseudomonas sp. NUPR-001]|uniref:tetratricopeptide repeat protein n=1 Tax=Pseudomonas sp. NUPR-001 TaxID=3416058 RepID=UPI003F97E171
MDASNYFSKAKTGGANASSGFVYQDLCALYYLAQHLGDASFQALGIETDDDFTLLHASRKMALQVKIPTLSVPMAKRHMGPDKTLIGSRTDNSLKTLLTYLSQYREVEQSLESDATKAKVREDFDTLLKRYKIKGSASIPATWYVNELPESNLPQVIKYTLAAWGLASGMLIDVESCFNELYRLAGERRQRRGYINKQEVLDLLNTKTANRVARSSKDFVDIIGIGEEQILDTLQAKIAQAQAYLDIGDHQRAITLYQELATLLETEALFTKCAAILHASDQLDAAIAYCDKALARYPNSAYAFAIKGSCLGEKGDHRRALDLLKSANHFKPEDAVILYNLGVCCLMQADYQAATGYFEQAVNAAPDFSSAHLNLSICLFNQNGWLQAAKHIDTCLLLEPELPQALSQKGEIKRFFGEYDEAQALFRQCLAQTPDNSLAQQGLALSLLVQGDPLGAALLVRHLQSTLANYDINDCIGLIDIGWHRTIALTITVFDDISYLLDYNGTQHYIPKPGNDPIGIGVIDLDGAPMPLIFKCYERLGNFKNAVNALNLSDTGTLLLTVQGQVLDLHDHCDINIQFEHYGINGQTNKGSNQGFNAFKTHYNGYCMLSLQHKQSRQQRDFVMMGLEVS